MTHVIVLAVRDDENRSPPPRPAPFTTADNLYSSTDMLSIKKRSHECAQLSSLGSGGSRVGGRVLFVGGPHTGAHRPSYQISSVSE